MSRFFDFLQRLDEPPSNSLPDSERAPENSEQIGEARQILSVLHRPQVSGDSTGRDHALELGNIPIEEVQVRPATRLVFHTDPTSPAADRFRLLRMRLRELRKAGKLRSVLVTSPLPGDGKSTIVLNLATALAEGGKRAVLLIDADLHHTSLNHQLRINAPTGLTQCLEKGSNPLSVIRRLEPLNWYLLPAGAPAANPTELLQTEALSNVIQRLSPHFDWVLIDSPPVIPLTDAVSLTHHTDGTLLVARAGHTPPKAIETAITLLGRAHVIGVALNGVEGLNRVYSKYAGYYPANSTDPDNK